MFVDEVDIHVAAGDGGRGCLGFRREKYVPRGGPSGGDGGHGGDIVMTATIHRNTLLHFRFNPEYTAQRGRHGEGSQRTGHDGTSLNVEVPVGTTVYDEETGEKLYDFTHDGETWLAAKGGRGGRGNARFATATHQAPTEHEAGKPGVFRKLQLKLRLLADVGLVGYPNAGKSTLISRISAAHPKIADYPFTTLEPYLGVVSADSPTGQGRTFVVADLPGLIEGAHEGAGLGTRFLRHIERTRLLAHLVDTSDASDHDPVHDFEVIRAEIAAFNPSLATKPMIAVATKLDATTDRARLEALRAYCAQHGFEFHAVSSASGVGITELVRAMADALDRLGPPAPAGDLADAESSGSAAQAEGR